MLASNLVQLALLILRQMHGRQATGHGRQFIVMLGELALVLRVVGTVVSRVRFGVLERLLSVVEQRMGVKECPVVTSGWNQILVDVCYI